MKTIGIILASVLCAGSPLVADSRSEKNGTSEQTVKENLQLGADVVSQIRANYEKGQYESFFKEMDTAYINAQSKNDLNGLVEMRANAVVNDLDKWEAKGKQLQYKKNQELLSALSDKDDSLLAKKVRSAVADLSTSEQEDAVYFLDSLLFKAPGVGKADENQLINLDLEYEFKALHVDIPLGDLSPQTRAEYQIALKMEKMDRMLAASKNFKDPFYKQTVSLAAANLDARLAQNLDAKDLNKMAKNQKKGSSDLERKIASIYSSYQAKFSDLFKEIADAKK